MTIQRYPTGFLELLGRKSTGENPNQLADAIAGVVDLVQLYGLSQQRYLETQGAAVAEGGGVTIEVPATEFWVLHDLSLRWAKTATVTALQGSLWIRQGLVGGFVGLATGPTVTGYPFGSTAASTSLLACYSPSPPKILPPGTVLYGTLDILGTDATGDITLSARVGVLD